MSVGNLGASDEVDALVADPESAVAHATARVPDRHAGRGVGEWFQPVPGGLLPVELDVDGAPGALLVGRGGSPLHAPTHGTVGTAEPDGDLVLVTDGGLTLRLSPDGPVAWVHQAGVVVRAGDVVGRFPGSTSGAEPARLVVTVTGDDGQPVDARDLLAGLPDPAELGVAAVPARDGTLGLVDPYEHDLWLARRERRRRTS